MSRGQASSNKGGPRNSTIKIKLDEQTKKLRHLKREKNAITNVFFTSRLNILVISDRRSKNFTNDREDLK